MNPDTKLSTDQLKAICIKQGITYKSHSRITAGFTHEVHRLNDDLIIKLFNTTDPRHYETESAMLASSADFPKPTLIASHRSTNRADRSYVIMTYVTGYSLGSRWHLAIDAQRESLIKEISSALRTINQINPFDIGLAIEESWESSIVKDGSERIARLTDKNIIDKDTAKKVIHLLEANTFAFIGSKLCVDYWDIHFDNFIVSEDFKLQALIDLENVWLTALDYPLFVIKKQMDEPEKYLSEADEKFANKDDYAKLKQWYRQYYPEMFAFTDLDTRVRLYQLLDTLHLLNHWSQDNELYVKLEQLISAQ